MVNKFEMSEANAAPEFGMACQRLFDASGRQRELPFGAMACFLPPGGSSEPDCHDEEEAMIILSGSGQVEVAGEAERIVSRDVVRVPGNSRHTVVNSGAETLVWVAIYWMPSDVGAEGGR